MGIVVDRGALSERIKVLVREVVGGLGSVEYHMLVCCCDSDCLQPANSLPHQGLCLGDLNGVGRLRNLQLYWPGLLERPTISRSFKELLKPGDIIIIVLGDREVLVGCLEELLQIRSR
jgi:hypothetical protein